jgi:hypothetical protein
MDQAGERRLALGPLLVILTNIVVYDIKRGLILQSLTIMDIQLDARPMPFFQLPFAKTAEKTAATSLLFRSRRCRRPSISAANEIGFADYMAENSKNSRSRSGPSFCACDEYGRGLMRLVPIPAFAGLDDERHGQLATRRAGTFHY